MVCGEDTPVIENLTAHDMSAYAPAVLIALLVQPGVAQHLDIEIKDLEARVVHVELGPLEEEEAVVVHHLGAPVQVQEGRDILIRGRVIDQIAGLEVEIGGVEVEGRLVVGDAEAEMSQLVDGGRALLETLRLVHGSVFDSREVVGQLGEGLGHLDGRLAVDEVEGEVVDRIVEGNAFAAARRIRVVDGRCAGEGRGQLEVFEGINYPCCAAKLVFVAAGRTVEEGLSAIAAIVDLVVGLLDDTQAKIQEKLVGLVEVLVSVVDVGDAIETDLLAGGRGRHGGRG